ncbi:hypothetical protein BKA82DRAFT_4020350 [Pisolithus tinctorius]|nr:hypothetical protein BKA82DRAFT_4020350 [Pisolithus tinctorius]
MGEQQGEWWQWFGMFQPVGTFLWKWGTGAKAMQSQSIMEQKSVRWRPGSPDTRFISPQKKPQVLPGADDTDMAVDELEFLLFGAAANATAWGHQLGSPSSSMPPNAGPSWPLLSMLAPSWDSPPLSPESWQGSHSMPSLAAIAPSWDSPTSSPAVSPPPRSLLASTQVAQTVPSPLEHACMDEWLDSVAATEPQPIPATSWQPSPEPMATDATAVTWVYKEFMTKGQLQHLVVLLMGPADEHLPHLNTTTDGPIVAAYNHYSNILVESSI